MQRQVGFYLQRQVGLHLRIWRGAFWHHGIFVGSGNVVHYSGLTKDKATATIRIDTLGTFGNGGRVEVVGYSLAFAPEDVVSRAMSRLGENGYHLFGNNCEHFARWCMTGDQNSEQVNNAACGAIGVGGGTAATVGSVGAVLAGGEVAGLAGGAGVMRGLRVVGGKVGGGAAMGLAVLTVAPTAAATIAMRRAFRDDDKLPATERWGRRMARQTATATGVLGAVGSVGMVAAAGVPGLSAVGITTGLSAIGGVVSGGMVAGVAMAIAGPALLVGLLSILAYKVSRSS